MGFLTYVNEAFANMHGFSAPELIGKQCLEAFRKMDPNVRVLIASGALNSEIEADLKEIGAKGLIAKPFDTLLMKNKLSERSDMVSPIKPENYRRKWIITLGCSKIVLRIIWPHCFSPTNASRRSEKTNA